MIEIEIFSGNNWQHRQQARPTSDAAFPVSGNMWQQTATTTDHRPFQSTMCPVCCHCCHAVSRVATPETPVQQGCCRCCQCCRAEYEGDPMTRRSFRDVVLPNGAANNGREQREQGAVLFPRSLCRLEQGTTGRQGRLAETAKRILTAARAIDQAPGTRPDQAVLRPSAGILDTDSSRPTHAA